MRTSNKIIFHFPTHINKSVISAYTIRPRKMQVAFATIGHDVIEISGYSKQRLNGILHAKTIIQSGKNIIFMYSESANVPTIFLDKD